MVHYLGIRALGIACCGGEPAETYEAGKLPVDADHRGDQQMFHVKHRDVPERRGQLVITAADVVAQGFQEGSRELLRTMAIVCCGCGLQDMDVPILGSDHGQ